MLQVDDTERYVRDTGGPAVRGKSKRLADYSFEACLRDLDAVLEARGVEKPLLVGWSCGGILGQHADVNIELNEIAAASVPLLERLTCPVPFVMATGDSLGSEAGRWNRAGHRKRDRTVQ